MEETNPQNVEILPKTPKPGFKTNGQFAPGNKLARNQGRRKSEFKFQELMDERIPRERWAEMLEKQVEKALNGDTLAFKTLVERRFLPPAPDNGFAGMRFTLTLWGGGDASSD